MSTENRGNVKKDPNNVVNRGKHKRANESLGVFLKNKRVLSKISKTVVCNYLMIDSEEVLDAYESGTKTIPLKHVYALSNCLNISPEETLTMIRAVGKMTYYDKLFKMNLPRETKQISKPKVTSLARRPKR